MKKFGKVSIMLVAAMSMALMSGCGKKNNSTTTSEAIEISTSTAGDATSEDAKKSFEFKEEDAVAMIDKFSGYCTLGDYKGIEYNMQNTVVDDAMVQDRVETLRNSFATRKEVKEGTTKSGDTVNIDYVGSVDGVPFDGGSSNGQGVDLVLGSGMFIPGFEEQVINHKVGEVFDINVTFPAEYQATELAGKEAVFNITINYIVENELPELTDAFIASYTDAKTIEEYEKKTKDDLITQCKEDDEYTNRNTVMDLAIGNCTVNEYPNDEVVSLVDSVMVTLEDDAKNNNMSLDDYVVNMVGMENVDAVKSYLSEQAKGYLKQKIIVCAIAKAENMTITKQDIDDIIEKIILNNAMDRQTLEETYTMDEIIYFAISEKVNDFIAENAVAKAEGDVETTEEVDSAETTEATTAE